MTLASRLSYSFEGSLAFCMIAVIFPSHLLKHSLTLGCSPHMQTVSPSAWRLLLPPSASLLMHPGFFSLHLVLYVGGLSPSLLLSQALFYYTYVNTFIFHSKKAFQASLIIICHKNSFRDFASLLAQNEIKYNIFAIFNI